MQKNGIFQLPILHAPKPRDDVIPLRMAKNDNPNRRFARCIGVSLDQRKNGKFPEPR
jgi:hypothetical protein